MTDKLTTIARPYAIAAFEYALDKNDLSGWGSLLEIAANIVHDDAMSQLLQNPDVRQEELIDIFYDVLGKNLTPEKKNFLHLLAEYRRLEALPDIAELFKTYQAQYEKTITVELISATALDKSSQQKIIDALTNRLKRKVSLQCKIDETLLGGAMVRAGDMVIDGSVRGKLNRLLESL